MRSRRSVLLLVSFALILLTVFSVVCIDASATIEVNQIPAMSVQSFYGSSFSASYTHDNNTYSTTFNYYDTYTSSAYSGANIDSNPVSDFNNYSFVVYAANVDDSQGNIDLLTIDSCSTYYSYYVRGGVGASCPLNYNGNSWSIIDYPNTYFGSFQGICGNTQASSELADYYGYVYLTLNSGWNDLAFRYIPFYSDDSPVFLETLTFENLQTYWIDGVRTTFIFFLTPFVGGEMSGSPPVSVTTSTTNTSSGGAVTTGDINVNVDVDVDMDETNGLLSDLIDTVIDVGVSIVSGVGDLFLPDDDYIENWVDDMSELVVDAFSDNVHEDTLKDILLDIGTYGATDSIRFPAVIVGDTTIIPSTSVSLVPLGRDIMVHVETAINLVCTMWVLNMVMNRIKGIIVGEKVVDIEGDDVE